MAAAWTPLTFDEAYYWMWGQHLSWSYFDHPPLDGWLQALRDLCDRHGIVMICDEVMAGFGRCGEWFAFQKWGVQPDLVCFAKGVNSGYLPLGGVIVSKRVHQAIEEAPFIDAECLIGVARDEIARQPVTRLAHVENCPRSLGCSHCWFLPASASGVDGFGLVCGQLGQLITDAAGGAARGGARAVPGPRCRHPGGQGFAVHAGALERRCRCPAAEHRAGLAGGQVQHVVHRH